MNNLEKKEKNLSKLMDKLTNLSASYSQSSYGAEKIITERNQLKSEKENLEKKYQELYREQNYLKEKVIKLQVEVRKKSELEEKFNEDINELSQETQELVEEIDKWQM